MGCNKQGAKNRVIQNEKRQPVILVKNIYIFFPAGTLRKKRGLEQEQVCFLFQMVKLRKTH